MSGHLIRILQFILKIGGLEHSCLLKLMPIKVQMVHKKTDRTQYLILRPQFRLTQDPIRFTSALVRSPANAV